MPLGDDDPILAEMWDVASATVFGKQSQIWWQNKNIVSHGMALSLTECVRVDLWKFVDTGSVRTQFCRRQYHEWDESLSQCGAKNYESRTK